MAIDVRNPSKSHSLLRALSSHYTKNSVNLETINLLKNNKNKDAKLVYS